DPLEEVLIVLGERQALQELRRRPSASSDVGQEPHDPEEEADDEGDEHRQHGIGRERRAEDPHGKEGADQQQRADVHRRQRAEVDRGPIIFRKRGNAPVSSTSTAPKQKVPRYFPSTSCVVETGAVSRSSAVPLRFSSANTRMHSSGATKIMITPNVEKRPR